MPNLNAASDLFSLCPPEGRTYKKGEIFVHHNAGFMVAWGGESKRTCHGGWPGAVVALNE